MDKRNKGYTSQSQNQTIHSTRLWRQSTLYKQVYLVPWRAVWGKSPLYISNLFYQNYVSYVKIFIKYKMEDTVDKHMLSRGMMTLVGAAALIYPQVEWVHLTQEHLHKVEMKSQFNMVLVKHSTWTSLYYQELSTFSSRIIEYHFLNSGHWT